MAHNRRAHLSSTPRTDPYPVAQTLHCRSSKRQTHGVILQNFELGTPSSQKLTAHDSRRGSFLTPGGNPNKARDWGQDRGGFLTASHKPKQLRCSPKKATSHFLHETKHIGLIKHANTKSLPALGHMAREPGTETSSQSSIHRSSRDHVSQRSPRLATLRDILAAGDFAAPTFKGTRTILEIAVASSFGGNGYWKESVHRAARLVREACLSVRPCLRN